MPWQYHRKDTNLLLHLAFNRFVNLYIQRLSCFLTAHDSSHQFIKRTKSTVRRNVELLGHSAAHLSFTYDWNLLSMQPIKTRENDNNMIWTMALVYHGINFWKRDTKLQKGQGCTDKIRERLNSPFPPSALQAGTLTIHMALKQGGGGVLEDPIAHHAPPCNCQERTIGQQDPRVATQDYHK